MAKAPSFPFYPGDWMKDGELGICSTFARGLLADIMCLSFECKTTGLFSVNGHPLTYQQIAGFCRGSEPNKAEGVEELASNGVLKTYDPENPLDDDVETFLSENVTVSGKCLYLRRHVRYGMTHDARVNNGRLGGRKTQSSKRSSKAQAKPQANGEQDAKQDAEQSTKQNQASSSSSSLSSNTEETPIVPYQFDDFWSDYPKKVGKLAAQRIWDRLKPDIKLQAKIRTSLQASKRSSQWTRDGGQFIPNPATWLHQGRWEDQLHIATSTSVVPRPEPVIDDVTRKRAAVDANAILNAFGGKKS